MAGDTAEELEEFRKQWQQEVIARSKKTPVANNATSPQRPSLKSTGTAQFTSAASPPVRKHRDETAGKNTHKFANGEGYHNLDDVRRLGQVGERIHPSIRPEPRSALDHYELAVERESEGSLGDSLINYRKAYRLDAGVDRIYKNKHFPPSSFKSELISPNPSNAAVTVPNPAHNSLDGAPASNSSQLIASFSSLSIPAGEPLTDKSPPPPCPISTVPSELLMNILLQTAIVDVASFARLSLVCKRLAYLVANEDSTWMRICLGPVFGFVAMHYSWTCTIAGGGLPISIGDLDNYPSCLAHKSSNLHESLRLSPTYPSYRAMFHTRPRIRFNGCYISTVNYIRPGGNTASQTTWNTPVHIVTYYRYLRFLRDGTCISLLTTTEPVDVVHYLNKENVHSHHAGALPSSVMNNALRGRWRLSGNPYQALNDNSKEAEEEEGTVHIETEGADAGSANPKYIYKMALQLRSASRNPSATRNNKLAWIGYRSYNKLTDDWAEFGLKNDRAFFWSRVRSYGDGE